MKGDVAVWMYVLAGIAVAAITLAVAGELLEYREGKGNPWPLYYFLKKSCDRNTTGEVFLKGPFVVEVVNGSFCYEDTCREVGCGINLTFGVGQGYYVYRVEVEENRVRLWPLPQS